MSARGTWRGLQFAFLSCALVWCAFGAGCGGGGAGRTDAQVDVGSDAAAPLMGTATLRDGVKVLTDEQTAAIQSMAGDTWTFRGAVAVQKGDVLLLDMTAVRVASVSMSAGQTIVTVSPVGIEDVFAHLEITGDLSLKDAEFIPGDVDPTTTTGPLRSALSLEEGIDVSLGESLTMDFDRPPFTAQLTLAVQGHLSFSSDMGVNAGSLNISDEVSGWARFDSSGDVKNVPLGDEKKLGIIRVPIPFTVADAALRKLGVRLASVMIPVSVGAEAAASYGVGIKLTGGAKATFASDYSSAQGLSSTPPSLSGSLGLSAELPGTGPKATSRFAVEAGIFVRLRPQLLILNTVASIGADIKGGLYAGGEVSAFLEAPYYCVKAQGKLKGEAFGFFQGVGISKKMTETYEAPELLVGPPFVEGLCGTDGGSDGGQGGASGTGDGPGPVPSDGGNDGSVVATIVPPSPAEGCGKVRNCENAKWPAPLACTSPFCKGDPRGAQGVSTGDPHLRTFDGLFYDFQAVGEFTLAASAVDDLEVQTRTKPWGKRTNVALNAVVAARVAGHRVTIEAAGVTRLDGNVVQFAEDSTSLPGGGQMLRLGMSHTVVWPDGSQLRTWPRGDFLEMELFLSEARVGKMVGLLGDDDRNLDGELKTRAGVVVSMNPTFEAFYGQYAESWRVTPTTSLFDYGAGETTETFTNRAFPAMPVSADMLSPERQAAAAAICAKAGITAPAVLQACILDVGITGDERFAEGLTRTAPPHMQMKVVSPAACAGLDEIGTKLQSGCVGGMIVGTQTVSFTVDVAAGNNVAFQIVDVDGMAFTPAFTVQSPAGTTVASGRSNDVAGTSFNADTAGTYTIIVSDWAGTATSLGGAFRLYLTLAPGANKGGLLAAAGDVAAHLDVGELDSYTFAAKKGEGIALSVTDVEGDDLVAAFVVYGPDGARVASAWGYDVAITSFAAGATGTYTVVVYDESANRTASGDYDLSFTRAPGANEGGALSPGDTTSAHLDKGALDSYTFTAQAGEGVALSVTDVDAATLVPAFIVNGPNGARVTSTWGYDVALTSFAAATTGTYTVVVYDESPGYAATGDYKVVFTKAPGANKGGALSPGEAVSAHLNKGALDSYTFAAQTGEGIALSVAEVGAGALVPAFIVYGPAGARVVSTWGYDVALTSFAAATSGTYTVVVYDESAGYAATGDYKVHFTKVPGANKGGALSPGGVASAHLDKGALDSYTFAAQTGDGIALSVAEVGAGTLVPAFIVYGPAGARVVSTWGYDVALTSFAAATTGTYTVVIYDESAGYAATGDYKVHFTKAPGATKGGALSPGSVLSAHLDKGALDSYTFTAQPGQSVSLSVTDVAAGGLVPAFIVYGPSGARVIAKWGYEVATASFAAATSGTYTVMVYDESAGYAATGDYQVSFTTTP